MTDEIYMALYHDFGTPTYITRRYSSQGEKIRDYEMIMNYWFPSLPLFPQVQEDSGIRNIKECDYKVCFENGILHADIPMPADVHVYSISGQPVAELSLTQGHNSIGLNLSQGIYIIRIGSRVLKISV